MIKLGDFAFSHEKESSLTLSRSWGIEFSIFLKIMLFLSFQSTKTQVNQIKYIKEQQFLRVHVE